MPGFWFFVALFLASVMATHIVRLIAIKRAMIDVPNERSSHEHPVPRGGGIAIFLCFTVAIYGLSVTSVVPWDNVTPLLAGGSIVAAIGLADDIRSFSPLLRLIGQFVGAGIALQLIGGLPPVSLPGGAINLVWIGDFLALVGIVWLINLYNFMDGINGIAAIEIITVGLGAALAAFVSGAPQASLLPMVLAVASCGFLVWNFPIPRVFMGDSGSGFLGIAAGILALQSGHIEPLLMWCWIILLGCFVVDTFITLVRRMMRGHRPHQAHRSHAYQFASRRFKSHTKVTLSIAVINMCWLLPISLAVATQMLSGIVGLVVAYAPLLGIALYLKAGTDEVHTS